MKPWNVEICDVTLRDGEQTPGVSFSCEEKVDIARTLDAIGIEVIEAGFPAVSPNEKQCVKTIANLGLDARICGFCRAREPDIETAIDCDVDMVSIFIPTSDLHIRLKFKKPREQVLEDALERDHRGREDEQRSLHRASPSVDCVHLCQRTGGAERYRSASPGSRCTRRSREPNSS